MSGCPLGSKTKSAARQQLVEDGQAPHTAIIGCADSRAPLETIFDAMPGARKVAGKNDWDMGACIIIIVDIDMLSTKKEIKYLSMYTKELALPLLLCST